MAKKSDDKKHNDDLPIAIKSKFKILSLCGYIFYFLGWLSLLAVIVYIIVFITKQQSSAGLMILGCLIGGLSLLATSQIIECLLSTEKHTRAIYKLIEEKLG